MSFIFAIYFLEQFEPTQHKHDWNKLALVSCCVFCGIPSKYRPKLLPTRVLFIFGILSGMLFTIVFLARLLKIIGNPIYNGHIRTTETIIGNSFKIFGDSFGFQHLKKQKEVNVK